jgi:hypothetical protein
MSNGFNISDLKNLGDNDGDGPGILDPFASLPERGRKEDGYYIEIKVTKVVFSTDAGEKPWALQSTKGLDRKMHYVRLEVEQTLVDTDGIDAIDHPEDEPLPKRTDKYALFLFQAEGGSWSDAEQTALATKVRMAEQIIGPFYAHLSMPLAAFDPKSCTDHGLPAPVAKMIKGRKVPLGNPMNNWGEALGKVFLGEIKRRTWEGRDQYDVEILGLRAPNRIGAELSHDSDVDGKPNDTASDDDDSE